MILAVAVEDLAVAARGKRGGRGSGRGRGGRGRGTPRRTFANNVDITDPQRNFTSAEWEKLGTMRSYVLQLRNGGGQGRNNSRGNAENRSTASTNASRTTSGVAAGNNNDAPSGSADHSVVSDITERGSQNGRSFIRGAYNKNNATA